MTTTANPAHFHTLPMRPSSERPDSPCKGVCTTTYDEVCRGCGRHYLEVAQWVTFTQEQKDAVWARLESQKGQRE